MSNAVYLRIADKPGKDGYCFNTSGAGKKQCNTYGETFKSWVGPFLP
jgi:hypothetical protein